MTTGVELMRAAVFVLAVGLVFVAAAVVLVRRFGRRGAPPMTRLGRAAVAVAAVGVLCGLYGRFVEPRWLEVTTERVATPRLPPGHRGVRIVHLSDIHSEPAPRLEERLPGIVESLRPDLIVFTGDCANSPAGVPVFRQCLAALARVAPTFAVKGNWDEWFFPEVERFAGTGAVELRGDAAHLDVAGATVHVVGSSFEDETGIAAALVDVPPEGPVVALYHAPYPEVLSRRASRVDLLCAGHVHGGQVALPFYGAIVTLSRHGKQYESGLYALPGGTRLHVSRGIGMEGLPVRFCARPEVTLIELVPSGSAVR